MRWFRCEDGRERANVYIPISLTANEIEAWKRIAKHMDGKRSEWRRRLGVSAMLGAEGDMYSYMHEYGTDSDKEWIEQIYKPEAE